jgi:hypothetical protein
MRVERYIVRKGTTFFIYKLGITVYSYYDHSIVRGKKLYTTGVKDDSL